MSWIDVVPFIAGLIAALAGGALVGDAVLSDEPFAVERRRLARAERNRVGQGALGASLVCTALVLLSGGGSPFTVAITVLGAALLATSIALNWRYLAERVVGPSHRAPVATGSTGDTPRGTAATTVASPAYGWPLTGDE